MTNRTFTITVPRTYTFEEGFGVYVEALWDDDERISEVEVFVVPIREAAVQLIGGVPCVPIDTEPQYSFCPVENFQHAEDLTVDDTHDLRCRWFATEDEAREHAESVKARWLHPSPWESFVTLD